MMDDSDIIKLMVYIKLSKNLYNRIKELGSPQKFVTCRKQHYLPYPQFKRIALAHNLQIHKEIGRHDIITYNDMELMIEKERQTPEQLKFIQQLKSKSQLRKLKLINSKGTEDFYFQKKSDGRDIKEMTQTISYSMAFIFSFFMAGLTGYYIGAYFLEWSKQLSLMIALVFIIITILLQTSLFILRQQKKQLGKSKNRPPPYKSQKISDGVQKGKEKNKVE